MWKYVSRRVKDTLERTCNVLDVSRTSFCSSSGSAEISPKPTDGVCPDGRLVLYKKRDGFLTWFRDGSSRFSGKEEEQGAGQERQHRERLHQDQDGLSQTWLSALTWVSFYN